MPIDEAKKIWMNGKFVNWKDAKVHILTHALHYGSGVFEGIRCYNTKKGPAVFRLEDHLKRLKNSAKVYQMGIPYSLKNLSKIIKKLILVNGLKECYIRPIVYRGYGNLSINPLYSPVKIAIAAFKLPHFLGKKSLEEGIKVKISIYERISPSALPLNSKATGQYINSVIAKLDAINSGHEDAIMLDFRGFISEGTSANIFLIKDGKIFTPPLHASILPGIIRETIIELSKDLGYEVNEDKDITQDFLYNCDEAFFTGTASEVTPIREIDGRIMGEPGRVTKILQEKFFDVVKGKEKKYEKWLEYV
jgi:branched-chain amino acid aminotransferase